MTAALSHNGGGLVRWECLSYQHVWLPSPGSSPSQHPQFTCLLLRLTCCSPSHRCTGILVSGLVASAEVFLAGWCFTSLPPFCLALWAVIPCSTVSSWMLFSSNTSSVSQLDLSSSQPPTSASTAASLTHPPHAVPEFQVWALPCVLSSGQFIPMPQLLPACRRYELVRNVLITDNSHDLYTWSVEKNIRLLLKYKGMTEVAN